jgi:hypothetical protein
MEVLYFKTERSLRNLLVNSDKHLGTISKFIVEMGFIGAVIAALYILYMIFA